MFTLPPLSATFLNLAVTDAASSTSVATIFPSSSLTAFIMIGPSASITTVVSLPSSPAPTGDLPSFPTRSGIPLLSFRPNEVRGEIFSPSLPALPGISSTIPISALICLSCILSTFREVPQPEISRHTTTSRTILQITSSDIPPPSSTAQFSISLCKPLLLITYILRPLLSPKSFSAFASFA